MKIVRIFAIAFILTLPSCVYPYFTSPYYSYVTSSNPKHNVEIYCPEENVRIIITRTTINEVKRAIERRIKEEKENKKSDKDTTLKLDNYRDFFIKGIQVSRLKYCRYREALRDEFRK